MDFPEVSYADISLFAFGKEAEIKRQRHEIERLRRIRDKIRKAIMPSKG